ncbi:predicted protein [Uncinocarpus reesii 1704]|uniref:C6 finger domain transcription factor nscR n=1 Tax=Uncinocarpus reesii (strain UAMH 1704) TaxID=336963 RepID=C4JNL1_UNCRE|nr:uncharacterized protein UREG_03009 [Uncinocarpus reesii 1704]EEP78164.1 predicted protein [Uncinocarpus reesii 1704]
MAEQPSGPKRALSSISPKPVEPSSLAKPSTTPSPLPNPTKPAKGPSTRRALSCLPCRRHKLKCDRHVPCYSCTRYRREDLCRKHPAPSSLLEGVRGGPKAQTPAIAAVSDNSAASATSQIASYSHATQISAPAPFPRPETFPNTSSAAGLDAIPPASLSVATTLSLRNPVGQYSDTVQRLAGTSILPRSLPFLLSTGQTSARQAEVALFWKTQLVSFLPSKYQCDLLVMYFLEHINWVYHFLHPPSFQDEYAAFWNTRVQDVNLIWLSFLYAIMASSAVFLPFDAAEKAGFPRSKLRNKSHEWYSASRQALHAGGFESRPSMTQLLTFLAHQLYWLATKDVEALNSFCLTFLSRIKFPC